MAVAEYAHFTESSSVGLWSGRLTISPTAEDAFEQRISQLALETQQHFAGFTTKDSNADVISYTRTRYPRKAYGVTSVKACISGLDALAAALQTSVEPELRTTGFRVVLGRLEGYNPENPVHSIAEIQAALPEAYIEAADICTVRPDGEATSMYREPAAVITASLAALGALYHLADHMHQECFTVENFGNGQTYVVETRYCRSD